MLPNDRSGDPETRALLEAAGFKADHQLRVWLNRVAGAAISFETVRERKAPGIAEWLGDRDRREN